MGLPTTNSVFERGRERRNGRQQKDEKEKDNQEEERKRENWESSCLPIKRTTRATRTGPTIIDAIRRRDKGASKAVAGGERSGDGGGEVWRRFVLLLCRWFCCW